MKRASLLRALDIIKPGVDIKDKSQQGQDLCLITNASVSAFNNEIAVTCLFDTPITGKEVNIMVKAADLITTAKKMKLKDDADINIIQDGDTLSLITTAIKATLAGSIDPEVQKRLSKIQADIDGLEWAALPSNFQEAVTIASFAASKKESQFTLACVYVSGYDVLGSDNDKVAWYTLDDEMETMLIRAASVKHIVAMNPTQYSLDDAFYHFKNEDGAVLSIRQVSGDYPTEYVDFFEFKGVSFVLPKDIESGIDVASVFLDDAAPMVQVDVNPGYVFISSGNARGSAKSRAKIDYKGEAFTFMIDPSILTEFLKYSTTITVDDKRNTAKITNDDETLQMLTTLMAA